MVYNVTIGALCAFCCIYVLWASIIIEKKKKEILHTKYLEDIDSYSDISFLNFLGKLGPKNWKGCPFWLKIGTQSISGILVLFPKLFFVKIYDPKHTFGQIWDKKFKIITLVIMIMILFSFSGLHCYDWSTVYFMLCLCFVSFYY